MNFFQNILAFFKPQDNTIDLKRELIKQLAHFDDVKSEEKQKNKPKSNLDQEEQQVLTQGPTCVKKTGIITKLQCNSGMIDNKYQFNINDCKDVKNIKIRARVSFTLLPKDGEFTNVATVQPIVNASWDPEYVDTADQNENENDDNEQQVFGTYIRKIIGKIKKRRLEICIVDVGADVELLYVNLETIKINFVPQIGDRVFVNCLVEIDDIFSTEASKILKYIQMEPFLYKTTVAKVDQFDGNTGVIGDDYFFTKEVLDSGYLPKPGDLVSVEAIEREFDHLNYRCLKVFLFELGTILPKHPIVAPRTEQCLKVEKHGLRITGENKIDFNQIGDTVNFEIHVENVMDVVLPFRLYVFTRNGKLESQLKIIQKPTPSNTFEIKPHATLTFTFEATAKFFGSKRETIVIYSMRKYFNVYVHVAVEDDSEFVKPKLESRCEISQPSYYNNDAVKNLRLVKSHRSTSSFLVHNIQQYEVPEKLIELFEKYRGKKEMFSNSLDEAYLFLKLPLSPDTFSSTFHILLFLEELMHGDYIRRFNKDRAHFTRDGEYLSLELENLADSCKSVVIGDTVTAYNPWTSNQDKSFQGQIAKVLANRILLRFDPSFHSSYKGDDYTVLFRYSRIPYRKQHHAISFASKYPAFLFSNKINLVEPQIRVELNANGELFNKQNNAPISWHNTGLNQIQKQAICNILLGEARPMPYVIFGPPGTGKTITLVEAVLQLTKNITHSRIIICTPSNSSANLITERLINSNALLPGDFVRLVSLNAAEKEMIPIHLLPYSATVDLGDPSSKTRPEMADTASGLIMKCNSKHIGLHRITIGTSSILGSLFNMRFKSGHFTHIVIDEVGQLTEPQSLIPMMLLTNLQGQIIIAGDPMQLGPVVVSREAESRGFGTSLLSRFLNRAAYEKDVERFPPHGFDSRLVTKLVNNYRSIPSVMTLYSELFYDNHLVAENGTGSDDANFLNKVACALPTKGANKFHGVYFYGVKATNRQVPESPSWFNPCEVKTVYLLVQRFLNCGVDMSDIGVVTPYKLQGKMIRQQFIELYGSKVIESLKVGSVEEFQGQERKIIIISTVRTCPKLMQNDIANTIGFVKNAKRMNVAISRARSLLVVCGDPHLLVADSNWRHILFYCVKNNAYTGCDLPDEMISLTTVFDRENESNN